MKKRIISLLLILALTVSALPMAAFPAYATVNVGECGANLIWKFDDETGKLSIIGDGDMTDYGIKATAGWYQYRNSIKEIVVEDGVTSIGSYAFYRCVAAEALTIGKDVVSVKNGAFTFCTEIKTVIIEDIDAWFGIEFDANSNPLASGCTLENKNGEVYETVFVPSSLEKINDYAFEGYKHLKELIIPDGNIQIGENSFYGCDSLKTLYYAGSEDGFAEADIASGNDALAEAEIIFSFLADICGDVTGDGSLNTKDVLFLRKHLAGLEEMTDDWMFLRADATGDGSLNTKDVLAIRKYIGGLISEFDAVANQK